eukprot:7996953-Alexandrium_andersonii.AAC.1
MAMVTEMGMSVCGTWFQQRDKSTWYHPRFGGGRMIDHILFRRRDHGAVKLCKTCHYTPQAGTDWRDFTDHDPIKVIVRADWRAETGRAR